jgi:ribosome-associated translation inhibitor RaiA
MQLALDLFDLVLIAYAFWRLHKKVNIDDVYGQEELAALDDAVSKIEGDLAEIKAKVHSTKIDVYDYVDGVLRPLHQRLSTRQSRLKQSEEKEQESTKRGGIIPLPNKQ